MADTMGTGMRNLKSKKLYLRVYEELRDYIIKRRLRPGDKLPTEMEMCEELGVSRNVLREAIKTLEITGVVSSKPGVGIVVQEFNPDYLFETLFYSLATDSENLLQQTMSVRRVLELGYMHEAFETLCPEDLRLLEQHLRTMESVYAENAEKPQNRMNWTEFSQADADFHDVLFGRIGNRVLSSIINAIWNCDRYYLQTFTLARIEQTIEKHRRILEALKAQDEQAFSEAMESHFVNGFKFTESTR